MKASLNSDIGTENGGDGYSVTMLPIEVLTTQLKVCLLQVCSTLELTVTIGGVRFYNTVGLDYIDCEVQHTDVLSPGLWRR